MCLTATECITTSSSYVPVAWRYGGRALQATGYPPLCSDLQADLLTGYTMGTGDLPRLLASVSTNSPRTFVSVIHIT